MRCVRFLLTFQLSGRGAPRIFRLRPGDMGGMQLVDPPHERISFLRHSFRQDIDQFTNT